MGKRPHFHRFPHDFEAVELELQEMSAKFATERGHLEASGDGALLVAGRLIIHDDAAVRCHQTS